MKLGERIDAVLRGAFAGPPTKLKDIPKRSGESRALRAQPNKRKRRASKAKKHG